MRIIIRNLVFLHYSLIIKIILFSLFSFSILKIYDIGLDIEKEISQLNSGTKSLNWSNIKKGFEILAIKYKYLIKREKIIPDNSPIWVMWYQGIRNAPPIVKLCINSIIINKGKHHVNIIDKFNLDRYIKLPYYIIEKFKNGTFSITHLSDIVRMALLYKYGGIWIDSTIFVTNPLKTINSTFYSLKKKTCFKHPYIKCKWVIYILGTTKHSFISTYGYSAFLFYLKKYNSFIAYFLLDYIIHIGYTTISQFKNIIDKLPYDNCNIWLAKFLNYDYNNDYFRCSFNKLTYKSNFIFYNGTKQTNYGYLIEKYNISV